MHEDNALNEDNITDAIFKFENDHVNFQKQFAALKEFATILKRDIDKIKPIDDTYESTLEATKELLLALTTKSDAA